MNNIEIKLNGIVFGIGALIIADYQHYFMAGMLVVLSLILIFVPTKYLLMENKNGK